MYSYETEKKAIFTEQGQVMFLKIRDRINDLLSKAGAVRMQEAISGISGDSWGTLACVDRLVELGEIREAAQGDVPGQYRVFVKA